MTSLVVQMVKHLPTMRETLVQSLGQEDLLEKEMTTLYSILAWKIPWTEQPDVAELDTTKQLSMHTHIHKHTHTHIYIYE